MATLNVSCNKDARIANSMGAGTSSFNPFGTYSGYRYRTLLGFPLNFSGWTSITSAYLYVRTSTQSYVAFGSDPNALAQRITANWSEGSSSGLSGSNAVTDPGPAVTGTSQVLADMPTTEGTWVAINITQMMRDVLNGQPFYGIAILGADNSSAESGSASNVGEIYSREGGSAPYIAFTYETNRAPNAPTVASPDVAAGVTGSLTPTLNFTLSDPDANALTQYRWQIDDAADFATPLQDLTVSGSFANNSVQPVVPSTLTRGVTYYVRVQAKDASVYGGWSTTFSFKVASLPTLSLDEPSAAGRLGKLQYQTGWAAPRLEVDWTFACPDGGTQASWHVELQVDTAGSPGGMYEDVSGTDAAVRQLVLANPLTEGAYYHVQVTVTCSHGLQAQVTYRRLRVRWGVVTHRFDMGAATGSLALTVLDVTDSTTGGSGKVVVEFMTTTGTGVPSSWAGAIGGAGLNRYLWYRAWLLAWGASPAVSPTLNEIKVTYSTATILPDQWVMSDPANQSGDVSSYVYGTKSFRMKGSGALHYAWQQIPVAPDTLYMVSGRIQTLGAAGAYIELATASTGGQVARTPTQAADIEFENPLSRVALQPVAPMVTPTPWNSGSNTSIYIRLVTTGALGTTAWFDAIKVEASSVVTPWSPGYVAQAVVLDAGGLSIDAANGGIFRLRGSGGLAADEVSLGVHGLEQNGVPIGSGSAVPFVGNSPPGSPTNGQLWWDDDDATAAAQPYGAGTSFPAGPLSSDRFFRTDLGMEFFFDGTRWLSSQLFVMNWMLSGGTAMTASGALFIGPIPVVPGCSDVWLEEWIVSVVIATGGTALSASHSWTNLLYGRYGSTSGTNTPVYAQAPINSGASDTWRRDVIPLNTLMGGLPYVWAWYYTKVGTPGNMQAASLLNYRMVAV